MPTPLRTADDHLETLRLSKLHGNSWSVERATGINSTTFRAQLAKAKAWQAREGIAPVTPVAAILPDPDIPIEDLLSHRRKSFEARHAHKKAKLWRRFQIPTAGPYALMFFGDPHLDDDGCNLPLWESHVDLAAATPHLYAVNIGDTTNNWTGRMAKLWAEQEASANTARKLVKHYLGERGIPWFLWLHGNHDMWDGPVGRDVFEGAKPHYITMEDWQAKVTLVSPNGHELRLWAAHNFKGNSIWNPMHGPLRAAQMEDWAHLYVAGHHHNCGLFQHENPHRRFVANGMRVRGYKFDDSYADMHQFAEHQYGAAGIAIIDPAGDKINAVTCFLDPLEAVEVLEFKRRKFAA
jgi:hypothetical protein